MTSTESLPPRLNRWALASLGAAILTLAAVCGGIAPIPLTGFICFPAAAVFGLVALGSGLWSLQRTKRGAEGGRALAWVGASVGGLAVLVLTCLLGFGIWLYPSVADLVRRFAH